MNGFDNPKNNGISKKLFEPEMVICPKCNRSVKNHTAIGGAICWKCKKVIPVSGMMKW
ncbi:MAG: hypothetical protein IJA34_07125 [Lachnospiraceae bacterium]|nr:hypothetical protein [Lachnospiraceae bacterium]